MPLGKNITFHRYIAYMIAANVALHTVAHYANYALAAAQTKAAYGMDQTKLVSASLSTRQTWTALQHDGPNHLGLWLIRSGRSPGWTRPG